MKKFEFIQRNAHHNKKLGKEKKELKENKAFMYKQKACFK